MREAVRCRPRGGPSVSEKQPGTDAVMRVDNRVQGAHIPLRSIAEENRDEASGDCKRIDRVQPAAADRGCMRRLRRSDGNRDASRSPCFSTSRSLETAGGGREADSRESIEANRREAGYQDVGPQGRSSGLELTDPITP